MIDVRALGILRIALGAILFVDLALRTTEVRAMYSDDAAYTIERARQLLFVPMSVHLLSGAVWFQGALLALGMLVALALVVGYRTRLATVVSWYLLVSLHHRSYYIQDVGDQLLRLLLLWSVFLPLGRRYSVDARAAGRHPSAGPGSVLSIASAGWICQFAAVYFFGAIHKLRGPTWRDGSALGLVLDDDIWVRPLGEWLAQLPLLPRLITHATVFGELLLPLLLLSPIAQRASRRVAIPLLVLFPIGIGSCMRLGIIPWLMLAGLVPFLPAEVWNRLDRRLGTTSAGPAPDRADPPAGVIGKWLGRIVPGLLFIQLFTANIDSFSFPGRVPVAVKKAEFCLGLDQAWAMYAPDPVVSSFRVILRFDHGDGEPVQLVLGGDRDGWPEGRTFEPFEDLWSSYRGRTLLDYIVFPETAPDLRPFLIWACREWSRAHPDRVVRSAGISKEVRAIRHGERASGEFHEVLSVEPLLGHICEDHD